MRHFKKITIVLFSTTAIILCPFFIENSNRLFGVMPASAQSAPPSPNTREGSHWLSAVEYYNQAQAALGRMQLHPEGTWQFDSAKKNYEHNVMRYIQFAARAGATVTADTHPSSVFNSPQAAPPFARPTESAAQTNNQPTESAAQTNNQPTESAEEQQQAAEQHEKESESQNHAAPSNPSSDAGNQNPHSTARENPTNNQSTFVQDVNNLPSIIGQSTCGQTIILSDGNYNSSIDISVNCHGKDPLIIKAESPQRAVFRNLMTISGNNIEVRGLYFLGRSARMIVGGENNRIIANKFEGWASSVALTLWRGRSAVVSYNEFTRPDPYTGTTSSYPLRIAIRSSHREAEFHYGAHIHHNHFHDFPAKPNPSNYHSGQNDTIEVCFTGSQIKANWIIEYNLIENHRQGHGILDVKCSGGVTVQFNTILNSPGGRIDFRNGDNGRMIANWIENAGGIAIHGDRHDISGNVIIGSGNPRLMLTTGNVASNGKLAETQSANFNTLSCNRATHDIGVWNMQHPARNNVINTPIGQLNLRKENGTRVNMNARCEDVPSARRLSANEVGPRAWPTQ